ncbi:MAG: TRAP transporter small permease subunit [Deferribacterales bacterium]
MYKLEKLFDRFADVIGYACGILMFLLVANVFYDVIMRYFFRSGSIAMQEMEWHLFSLVFLLGMSYTFKEDGHVRVDVIYDTLKPKKKAIINLVGIIFFLIPFSLLIAYGSIPFVSEAYTSGEISGDPGGLTHRWIIKFLIPLSFILLIISSVGVVVKNINIIRANGEVAK